MLDKKKFLEELQAQLADLTSDECREALEYYEEYFADAGEENEADVLISLGTPQQVAEQIKAGLHKAEEGMFTENGYREKIENDNPPEVYGKKKEQQESGSGYAQDNAGQSGYEYEDRTRSGNGYGYRSGEESRNGYGYRNGEQNQNGYGYRNGAQDQSRSGAYGQSNYNRNRYGQNQYGYQGQQSGKKSNMSGGMLALLIILGICASPIIIGLGAGIFGVAVGILGAIFGLIVAFLAVIIGLFAAGIALFFAGFPIMFHNPFAGMFCIAVGCFMIALFILCTLLLVTLCSKFFPWMIREVESFGKYLSRKWAERKRRGGEAI